MGLIWGCIPTKALLRAADIENLLTEVDNFGIKIKDSELIIKSLTHKSRDSNYNNEKLEFLGDRVLGLVLSKTLLKIFLFSSGSLKPEYIRRPSYLRFANS